MKTQINQPESYLFLFKNTKKILISSIILLEGQGNYTNIHLQSGKKLMVAKTLKSFEELLANHQFYRIHRAFLININHLKSYNSTLGEALLTDNQTITTSRRKKTPFEEKLNWVQ
jgi:two-component system, LytTR family, response regulator